MGIDVREIDIQTTQELTNARTQTVRQE